MNIHSRWAFSIKAYLGFEMGERIASGIGGDERGMGGVVAGASLFKSILPKLFLP